MLICAVDAAIEAIERGSTSAPIAECLKAARAQFLEARAAFPGTRLYTLDDIEAERACRKGAQIADQGREK